MTYTVTTVPVNDSVQLQDTLQSLADGGSTINFVFQAGANILIISSQ